MPIGVPRIIYCWGEETSPQWTDIYNFIFRRRMVFLMQYLDDELCNQICGLLINIHMDDRSPSKAELEKRETGNVRKSRKTEQLAGDLLNADEDMLNVDEDMGIDDIFKREQLTLQKITTDWLSWNAQFFDYADEPYLAELLTKDFNHLNKSFQRVSKKNEKTQKTPSVNENTSTSSSYCITPLLNSKKRGSTKWIQSSGTAKKHLDVYSPFIKHLTNDLKKYSFTDNVRIDEVEKINTNRLHMLKTNTSFINKVTATLTATINKVTALRWTKKVMNKTLSQLLLKKKYLDALSNSKNSATGYNRDYYNATEKTLMEEEYKKVFVIINSFGGSVGNGITVHDALQFIKAGSLTLGLGVAASAASLALAGGTIGQRYVTEGCHTMLHQPESSISGQASDIWIDSMEILKIRKDVADIYSLSTYRPRHKILRDLDRDFYLTATETINYGLADEIATNEVMHSIVEQTGRLWSFNESSQQRLLENRENEV